MGDDDNYGCKKGVVMGRKILTEMQPAISAGASTEKNTDHNQILIISPMRVVVT